MAVRPIDANMLKNAIDTDFWEHFTQCHDSDQTALIDMVMNDIDEMPTFTIPNEPLMFDQLQALDGKSAYVPETNCCVLITKNQIGTLLFTWPDGEQCSVKDWYEQVGPVYSYAFEVKNMELIIKDMDSLKSIVESLVKNGYTIEFKPIYKMFPETTIDYYAVKIIQDN